MSFEFPKVKESDNNTLQQLPNMENVCDCLFIMNVDSAPGPDGFEVSFYRFCWEVIKDDLLSAIHDFFKGI